MAQQRDGEPQRPDSPARAGTTPPPPRPGLSYAAPAPILVTPPAPRSVRLAQSFWLLSFVAGLAVLVGSFLARESNLARLRTVVDQMAPGGDAAAVTASSAIVFWGSLAALLLATLLEAAALAAVTARHGWTRWLMAALLAGHAAVMAVAAAFLVPEGDAGSYVVLLWGAELLLAFVGLVALFVPSAGRWLKSRRALR
ncbi:hypothetical protein ACS5PJ_06555 [Pseudarthrobacter sp. YS3]|uniref:hypothetical protein n=1 Tax=Pseudarthrobacter sp. YS3 TaxID=3453718 RepID=UPI003EEA0FA3